MKEPRPTVVLCGGVRPRGGGRKDAQVHELTMEGKEADVRFSIEKSISGAMGKNLPDRFVDLLEIAAYVYVADQLESRGGTTDAGLGSAWRRDFHFHVPVRDTKFWKSANSGEALSRFLSDLSDDAYSFTFHERRTPRPLQELLELGDDLVPADDVMLFSGGLDSMAGAVQQLILDRRPTLLVSHRAAPVVASAQDAFNKALGEACGEGPSPVHLPVWVNKIGKESSDETQRSRIFLFATIGAAFSVLMQKRRLKIFENGPVSFNLPPCEQVVGARATRGTHPQTLTRLSGLFSLVLDDEFKVENPFLFKTKAEVIDLIGDAGHPGLIGKTISCSRTRNRTVHEPNCGRCMQCVVRRYAALASKYASFDEPTGYGLDLFEGVREEGPDRILVEAHYGLARRIMAQTDVSFFDEFPELQRALFHCGFASTKEAGKAIWEVHRRNAGQIVGVARRAIEERATALAAGTISRGSLLAMIVSTGDNTRPKEDPVEDEIRRRLLAGEKRGLHASTAIELWRIAKRLGNFSRSELESESGRSRYPAKSFVELAHGAGWLVQEATQRKETDPQGFRYSIAPELG